MTNEEKKQRVEECIAGLAEDMAPLVKDIEARPNTSQNHYVDYGAVIRQFGGDDQVKQGLVAVALVRAGANRQGITTAYNMVKDNIL